MGVVMADVTPSLAELPPCISSVGQTERELRMVDGLGAGLMESVMFGVPLDANVCPSSGMAKLACCSVSGGVTLALLLLVLRVEAHCCGSSANVAGSSTVGGVTRCCGVEGGSWHVVSNSFAKVLISSLLSPSRYVEWVAE